MGAVSHTYAVHETIMGPDASRTPIVWLRKGRVSAESQAGGEALPMRNASHQTHRVRYVTSNRHNDH